MENEEWRDIEGYDGYYQVSNLGRVRSVDRYLPFKGTIGLRKGNILKQIFSNKGYKTLKLSKDGKNKRYSVHRLVAETFIPNPNNLKEVNHIDEDKTNNNVENLEWCDTKYNINYGTRIERQKVKLSKPVLQFTLNGQFVAEYPSIIEAYRQIGIYQQSISECCKGKRKSAGGYIWRFKNCLE